MNLNLNRISTTNKPPRSRKVNNFFFKRKLCFVSTGGVVKVEIYEVDTKIELKVETF